MKALHLVGPPPYQTNSFLLISSENRAILIDPAVPAARVNKLLEEKTATLSMILLTHGHFDHVTYVKELAQAWKCPVYLDQQDARGNQLYPIKMDTLEYTEGGRVELDDISITTWHTPGHSKGSWLLLCGDLLFCGDTLFAGDVGRTDLEGGSPAEQKQSLAKIKELPIDPQVQVLPGHGPFSTLQQELEANPYLMF